jgi:shikimate kinase
MGSGKSSIGRRVALQTHADFFDTDRKVVEQCGRTIAEIFDQEGETFFRHQERIALASFATNSRCVIATGGGIVTEPENRELIVRLGFVVFLTADEEVIFERVTRNPHRPLLQTANPRATVHDLLEKRLPLYSSVAHYTLDTSSGTHDELAHRIISEAERFFSAKVQP